MALPASSLTLDEYPEWEKQQPDGNKVHWRDVSVMGGARRVHGCIASNMNFRSPTVLIEVLSPALACMVSMQQFFDGVDPPGA